MASPPTQEQPKLHLFLPPPSFSTLNPMGYIHNCVSVTIARVLAYRNVNEFWLNVLGYPLQDKALTHKQLVECIVRAGWECRYNIYINLPEKPAYVSLERDSRTKDHQIVAYQRSDGTGHCAVRELRDGGTKFTWICYQQTTDGEDVSDEIQTAAKLLVYQLRCPPHLFRSWWRRRVSMGFSNSEDPKQIFENLNQEWNSMKPLDPIGTSVPIAHSPQKTSALAIQRGIMTFQPRLVAPPELVTKAPKFWSSPSIITQYDRVTYEVLKQYVPRRKVLIDPSKDLEELEQLFNATRLSAIKISNDDTVEEKEE
ncbi:hypothetical protein F4806DRAFT_317057 [Annulohypoxylon nitens]|nr:hypothetical protein F4806DRAFT_317057 [Annulohypoxylon nitens]